MQYVCVWPWYHMLWGLYSSFFVRQMDMGSLTCAHIFGCVPYTLLTWTKLMLMKKTPKKQHHFTHVFNMLVIAWWSGQFCPILLIHFTSSDKGRIYVSLAIDHNRKNSNCSGNTKQPASCKKQADGGASPQKTDRIILIWGGNCPQQSHVQDGEKGCCQR